MRVPARPVRRFSIERRSVAVAAAAAIAGALVLVPAGAQNVPPTASPTVGELIAGRSSTIGGVYAWTDYAYDDRGPDTNTRPGGDAKYPADMNPNNVADLIQVQFRADGEQLRATIVLETLKEATRPVVGVGVDSDGDASTGAPSLPGSWITAGSLGVDRLFVFTNKGGSDDGQAWYFAGGTWTRGRTFDVSTDLAANTLTATLPFRLSATGVMRAVVAAGYEHAGKSWLDGTAPVHDLAFVPGEDPTTPYLQGVTDAIVNFAAGGDTVWQDYKQSAILAGDADATPAVAGIDIAKLRRGRTDEMGLLAKGFHTFLYRSGLELGEGIIGSGDSALYAGPYQPYLVWAPGIPTAGLPLVIYLHGDSQTHLSAVNTAPYAPDKQDSVLGLPNAFFDDFRAIVVWPLGRGPGQTYSGPSEQDILDVHEDVLARLELNPDRVMLAGLSNGGIGTFRLAQLYPDRWSVAYSDVGIDQTHLLENLTSLPLRFQNGGIDYLVNVALALETRTRVDAAGTIDYRHYILHQRHHQPAVALAKCIYLQSFGLDRIRNPARVRYTVDPAMFDVNKTSRLSLVYDGAYWVDGMVSAGGPASVDLTSKSFGYVPVPRATTHTVEQNLTAGRDFCGPTDEVNTNDTWDEQDRVVDRRLMTKQRRIEGSLANLSAVTIDVARAGVATGTLSLVTDRPVRLTLTGLTLGTAVTNGDADETVRDGTATVSLVTGSNTVTISASRVLGTKQIRALPATGAGAPLGLGLALLVGAAGLALTVRRPLSPPAVSNTTGAGGAS